MSLNFLKRFVAPKTVDVQSGLAEIERDLARRHLDELSVQLTTSWKVYIQFYTVFLTANVIGLGLVAEKMNEESRSPVVFAFIFQNLISLFTAWRIGQYSIQTANHFQTLSAQIAPPRLIPGLKQSPIAANLGGWAGRANALSHAVLCIAWFWLLPAATSESSPAIFESESVIAALQVLPEPPPKNIPFDATSVAATHSSLAGVMAGFAFASLFLLIDRKGYSAALHSRAMLLLFTAFLMASLSSYFFSALTGEAPVSAYHLFLVPSMIFALHIFSVFAGINVAFQMFSLDKSVASVARTISYGVVVLCVSILGLDLKNSIQFVGHEFQRSAIIVFFVSAVVAPPMFFVVARKRKITRDRIVSSIGVYCYCILAISLAMALYVGLHFGVPEIFSKLFFFQAVLYLCIFAMAIWTCSLIHATRNSDESSSV